MFVKRVLFIVFAAAVFLALAESGPGSAGALRAMPAVGVDANSPAVTAAWPYQPGEFIISALDNRQILPDVAYNWKRHEYLVVWHNVWGGGDRDIYARRVSDQGELLSSFTVAAGVNDNAQPSVAYDPVRDRYLVVWIHDAFGNGSDWDVQGRFVPWNGPSAALSVFTVIDWGNNQWNPKVEYGRAQDEFLVVWTNTTTSPGIPAYISGRRIFADGSGFPGGGFLIASHSTENRVNPDVAYNLARNEYLVVYDNVVDIWGTRLSGSGAALGGGEFGIAGWPSTEQYPAVAACYRNDQYLVTWQSTISATNRDVYARYLAGNSAAGSVHHIEGTSVDEIETDVACNAAGTHYLTVFQQRYSNATGPFGITGRFFSGQGPQGPAFSISAPIAGQSLDRTAPAVAGGWTNFMTVWEHDRLNTSWQDIHGRLTVPNTVFLPLQRR